VGYACLTTAGEQVFADAQVSAEFACQEVYEAMVGEWNKAG
jgi:hypothetical protein